MSAGLTDDEIMEIARRMRRAAQEPPGDPDLDITAQRHTLSPEDEDRVEAALVRLGAADPDLTSRAERETRQE